MDATKQRLLDQICELEYRLGIKPHAEGDRDLCDLVGALVAAVKLLLRS